MNHIRVMYPSREWIHLVSTDVNKCVPAWPAVEAMPGVWRVSPVELRLPRNVLSTREGRALSAFYSLNTRDTLLTVPNLDACALYQHQVDAVGRIADVGCALLADVPGLGKTATGAITCALRQHAMGGTRPVVVCAPKALRNAWRRELVRLRLVNPEGDEFLALEGADFTKASWTQDQIRAARWIFVHYEIVAHWWSWLQLLRPCAIILDEAHLVKNARSNRGKAAKLITSIASVRVIMTGTPVLNSVTELHHLAELTTGPGTWGIWPTFRDRYTYADGFSKGPRNEDELRERLAPYYIRRTLDDAGVELPSLRREVIDVDLEDGEAADYQALLNCCDFSVVDLVRAVTERRASTKALEFMMRLRKFAARVKLKATIGEAQSLIEQGEPVVIFTWERAIADRIHKALPSTALVHGDVAQAKRDDIVTTFQAGSAHHGGIVATYGALGVGVTLTRARYVIMHDLDYVPATMLQAEARVHRITQRRATISKWMCAANTIDATITKIVKAKAEEIAVSVGDAQPAELADVLRKEEIDTMTAEISRMVEWARAHSV